MKNYVLVLGIALLSASTLMLAHGDAKGVVKERMDLMEGLKGAMKTLKPIMRGIEIYDIETVKQNALIIKNGAGNHMITLFPEGSLEMPSEAKAEIWREWDNFQKIASNLERLAQALHDGAANHKARDQKNNKGLHGMMGQAGAMQGKSMMNGQGVMGGKHHMTGQGMMDGKHAMNGIGMQGGLDNMSDEHLASMPSQGLFHMIGKTCGSCHKQYRVEK